VPTYHKPYGFDLGRLVDDYSAAFVITATDEGYAARRRAPDGCPYGPEVRDFALDGLAVRMDQLAATVIAPVKLNGRTRPASLTQGRRPRGCAARLLVGKQLLTY
jgi:hypothetical protein